MCCKEKASASQDPLGIFPCVWQLPLNPIEKGMHHFRQRCNIPARNLMVNVYIYMPINWRELSTFIHQEKASHIHHSFHISWHNMFRSKLFLLEFQCSEKVIFLRPSQTYTYPFKNWSVNRLMPFQLFVKWCHLSEGIHQPYRSVCIHRIKTFRPE